MTFRTTSRLTKSLTVLWPAAIAAVILVLSAAAYSQWIPYGIGWNHTPSIPTGLYFSKAIAPSEQLVHGDLVCFQYAEPAWARGRHYVYKGVRMCKKVAGLPGDKIEVIEGQLTVIPSNSAPTVAKLLPADSQGREMPQQALGVSSVPPDSVFALATILPNSLDSRYLGAIPRTRVTHKIYPLLTFQD